MTNTTFGKVKRLLCLIPKPILFLNEKKDEQPVKIIFFKKERKETIEASFQLSLMS